MTELPNPFFAPAEGGVPAGEISRTSVGTSIPSSCGGAETSRSADEPIGLCGLTDASCKWPTSRCEGETTTPAGIGSGPQDFTPAFQPNFEKLFSAIFELTDMQAVLICAEEELRTA